MGVLGFLEDLNTEQYDAATTLDGPLLILAGAGTGKTKTLISRLAYMVETGTIPERILLLTFTNKAADEMKERAEKILGDKDLKIDAGTFHSFCFKQLRRYFRLLGFIKEPVAIKPEEEAVAADACMVELKLTDMKNFPNASDIVTYISKAQNRHTTLASVLSEEHKQFAKEVEKVADKLKEYKTENNYVGFDDMLILFIKLLTEHEEVRTKIDKTYEYIMVDEYQDTNLLQDEILSLMRRDYKNIAVVGDDMQSIYSFRGAEVKNILTFNNRYRGCKTITLKTNYRSTDPIISVANIVSMDANEGMRKTLNAIKPGTIRPYIIKAKTRDDEAAYALDMIKKAMESGIPANEICVLARSSGSLNNLSYALQAEGIPFEQRGGVRFLDRQHIKDMICFLRALNDHHDELAWYQVAQIFYGVGKHYAWEIAKNCKNNGAFGLLEYVSAHPGRAHADMIMDLSVKFVEFQNLEFHEMIEAVINYYMGVRRDVYGMGNGSVKTKGKEKKSIEEAEEDFLTLLSMSEKYDNLTDFLDDLVLDAVTEVDGDAVILSTIHSAKGLEFNTVIIIDCAEGVFPRNGCDNPEEERRCFYVAVTRAKQHLFILYPEYIQGKDGTIYVYPSQFISNIWDVCEITEFNHTATLSAANF